MTAYCSVPGTALSALLTFPQAMLASLGARGSFCPYHPGRRLRHRTSANLSGDTEPGATEPVQAAQAPATPPHGPLPALTAWELRPGFPEFPAQGSGASWQTVCTQARRPSHGSWQALLRLRSAPRAHAGFSLQPEHLWLGSMHTQAPHAPHIPHTHTQTRKGHVHMGKEASVRRKANTCRIRTRSRRTGSCPSWWGCPQPPFPGTGPTLPSGPQACLF